MKFRLIIIFSIISILCFSQKITKKELKKIIRISVNSYDKTDYMMITDNQDSLFYKSEKVKIFTSSYYRYNLCRTLEFRFYKNKIVNLIDCQYCTEPTYCYVTKPHNIYNYKIVEKGGQLFMNLSNRFSKIKMQVDSGELIQKRGKKYYEIMMTKTEEKQ